MPVAVECPACEFVFSVPDEFAGKKGKCPECGNVFRADQAVATNVGVEAVGREPSAPPKAVGTSTVGGMKIPAPKRLAAPAEKPAAAAPKLLVAKPLEEAKPATAEPVFEKNEAPVGPLPFITENTDAGSNGESSLVRRRKQSGKPVLIAAIAGGLLLLVVGGIVLVYAFGSGSGSADGVVAGNNAADGTAADADVTYSSPAPAERRANDGAANSPTMTAAQLAQLWPSVRLSLCEIEVTTSRLSDSGTQQRETRSGSGFVIDARGWVATNLHLVRDAQSIEVHTFQPDLPFKLVSFAPGTVAIDPAHDLAILAVDFSSGSPAPLPLDSESTPLAGDPLIVGRSGERFEQSPLAACQVQNLRLNNDLPPSSKTMLRERELHDTVDLVWVQVDHQIGEQEDGAPLLDPQGRVVGVANRLSPTSKDGYAVPVKHLAALLKSASGDVTLFAATDVVDRGDPPDERPVEPNPSPMPPDEPDTQADPLLYVDLLADSLRACKDLNWSPATPAEYKTLQQLAKYVHEAKELESQARIEEGVRIIVGAKADDVLKQLSEGETPWPGNEQIAALNRLAAKSLEIPGQPVFAYLQIVAPSRMAASIDGQPSVVAELIGTEQLIVLPTKADPADLKKGTRWLLLGVHEAREEPVTVKLGESEQPAALVRAKYLLGQLELNDGSDKPEGGRDPRGRR